MKTEQIKENLKTEIPKTQKQILNFVDSYGSVCLKLINRHSPSKAESTITKHVRRLDNNGYVETVNRGNDLSKTVSLTDKGRGKIQ